jgi:transglutaminase-like putative cysteine protease
VVTTRPARDGAGVLYAVRAAALVVAVAAAVAAFRPTIVVVLAAAVTAGLFAWRSRDRHLPVLVALVCGAILIAGAVHDGSPDRNDVRIAVVALIVAGVVTVPLELAAMRPLRDGQPGPVGRDLVVPIAVLAGVALLAFALGPSVNLETNRASTSAFGGSTRVTQADGDVAQGIAPYLGFADHLDTSARGRLGHDVVLRVHADAPDFWRGESFNVWNGREWRRDESGPPAIVRTASDLPGGDAEPFRQHVKVEAPAIGTLYAAYRPLIVSLPPAAYRYNADGSIELRRPLGRGSEYTVQSLRPHVTADILRAHDPTAVGASQPSGAMSGPVPPRVATLARRITAPSPTTYDAVRAIEHWMGAHTTYTLDIPPLPKGADAVVQHLFVDRKGFCTQIATSTAVMLHSLGVPVRLGTGFTPGKESILGKDFTVRASDAHAWVEVWFPGVGWQAFDPTANVPLSGEYDGSLLARIWRALQRLGVAVVVLIAAIAFFVARTVRHRRRKRREEPWVHRMYRRVEREGRARGRPRRPNETPQQYLRALSGEVLPQPDQLGVVAHLVTVAAYGSRDLTSDEQRRAETALAAAVAASPRRRLRRWARPRDPSTN